MSEKKSELGGGWWSKNLDDVDREVCPCGYSYVVLAVSEFEPVYAERGQVIELPRRRKLSRAA